MSRGGPRCARASARTWPGSITCSPRPPGWRPRPARCCAPRRGRWSTRWNAGRTSAPPRWSGTGGWSRRRSAPPPLRAKPTRPPARPPPPPPPVAVPPGRAARLSVSAPAAIGPGGAGAARARLADPPGPASPQAAGRTRRPLYAAGFTTAFGAHAVAANLGVYTGTRHGSLLTLGILLAVYDGAEVILKPVFGALADRVWGKPVLIAGLLSFPPPSPRFLLPRTPPPPLP